MAIQRRLNRSDEDARQLRWRRRSRLVGLLTIPVAIAVLIGFVFVVEARISGGIDSILLEQTLLWLSLLGSLAGGGIAIVYGVKGRSAGGTALGAASVLLPVSIVVNFSSIVPPGYLRPGPGAEQSVVALLKAINAAEVTYMMRGDRHYGDIQELIDAGFLDPRFGERILRGYRFEITLTEARSDDSFDALNGYVAAAIPLPNVGRYGFYVGPDGVVRYGPEPGPGPGKVGIPVE